MNRFNLILSDGRRVAFDYNITSDLFMVLNMNQIFSEAQMKEVKIEIPNDLPKSRRTEVMNAVKRFQIPLVMTDDLEWEKLGIGKQTDFTNPTEVTQWLIERGADPKDEQVRQAVIAVKEISDKFITKWNELKKAKIVTEDAGVYFKTIEALRKKKS